MIGRFYYPKYLSPEEIVKRAGFVSARGSMGWERDATEDGWYRLHATTHGGRIDLHWDQPNGEKRHKISRTHPHIAYAIAEFGRIDRAAATWLTLAIRAITYPFKKGWEKW